MTSPALPWKWQGLLEAKTSLGLGEGSTRIGFALARELPCLTLAGNAAKDDHHS